MSQSGTQYSAVLLLQDGTVFKGFSAGKTGTVGGEICFNTGMTGYQEIFTDPSYVGQIMVMTNVHIGNYGAMHQETESDKVQIAGLVCRNFSNHFSRKLADESLHEFLLRNQVVCIHGIDTRSLVRHIRKHGAMNAVISSEILDVSKLKSYLDAVPSMQGLELASKVTTEEAYLIGNPDAACKVAVLDYGIKRSILRQLDQRGFYMKVFPAKSQFSEILKWNPDAFLLSNGPGDPESMDYAVETATQCVQTRKPLFGICLGHQILGLALGLRTVKMHNGHRGINHPVKNVKTGLGEITSQNHGFTIHPDSFDRRNCELALTHFNLNDNTVEGMEHKYLPVFSVQYHPEAGPGPHDARYLFQQFYNYTHQLNYQY